MPNITTMGSLFGNAVVMLGSTELPSKKAWVSIAAPSFTLPPPSTRILRVSGVSTMGNSNFTVTGGVNPPILAPHQSRMPLQYLHRTCREGYSYLSSPTVTFKR